MQKDQIIKTIQATEGKIKRSKNLSEKNTLYRLKKLNYRQNN